MTLVLDRLVTQGMGKQVSRRALLKGTAAAGAGFAALSLFGGFATPEGAAAGPLDSDLDILNYALTLEHLEAAAYRAINSANVLSGRAATYFQAFGAHESAHVDAVIATIQKLGGTPVQPAQYNFSSVPTTAGEIVKFFQVVESVGASAYLGAAPYITNTDVLEAALSIHAVEAEHAAALADIVAPGSDLFAPEAFATPRTPAEVVAIVAPFFAVMPGLPNTGGGFAASGGAMINLELGKR